MSESENAFRAILSILRGDISVPNYQELYFKLFSAAADAVEAIEAMNFGQAKEVLIAAQQEAEEQCMEA